MASLHVRRTLPTALGTEPSGHPLYESDFFFWTQEQSRLLREKRFAELDVSNLVDEVETLGRSVKREIASRLCVLLVHLLKWRYQSERRSRSWKSTILEQRRRIVDELLDSPSLRSYPFDILADEYDVARAKASGETDLPEETFPPSCPFAIDDILDPDFYPDGA